jgi:hypothetical protein
MTTTIIEEPQRRFYFKWIREFYIKPKSTFLKILSRLGNVWLTPITILSLSAIARELTSGWLKNQAALAGEITLPPNFQYYTAEQQAQFMQAMQSTQSPVFMFILPAMAALFGLWITWIITGSVIHLVLTLLGGRTEISTTLTIVAWASLPFLIKDIVRILFMLSTKNLIQYSGLSGLITLNDEAVTIFLSKFLARIDIYLIWYVILIIIGINLATSLSIGKTTLGILLTFIVLLSVGALIGYLLSTLGGLSVIRPFYF